MAETTTENTNPGTVEPVKKKGFKKLIILVLIVLALGGAGGYFYFSRSSSASETAEKSEKETKKSSSQKASEEDAESDENSEKSEISAEIEESLPDDEDVKNIIELEPFIVNLADDDQARYLRMTVSLGVGGEAEGEKPDTIFITRVRNAMLAVLSVKTSDDVLTIKGKSKLRKQLLEAAQAASEEPEVMAIYITDFIVQL